MEALAVLIGVAFMALVAFGVYARVRSIARIWKITTSRRYPAARTEQPDMRRFGQEQGDD